MTFDEQIELLKKQFNVIDVIELDHCHDLAYPVAQAWLDSECQRLFKPAYENNERIIFVQRAGDAYTKDSDVGIILRNLQTIANKHDISNFFIILLSNNPNLYKELVAVNEITTDAVTITGIYCDEGEFHTTISEKAQEEIYQYGSVNPVKISLDKLNQREQFLLTESKTFCMYPWIHLHAYPTGEAYPCCHAEMGVGQVGNCHKNTLEEIWHDKPMQQLRQDMLSEKKNDTCSRCYEQEDSGFFSGRRSANKHHGHHIDRINEPDFQMSYWDIRFSNLCNLSCRSCGHIFSSSWYQDQAKLAGGDWKSKHKVLNYAGRTKVDMWEQLIPHLDYVEQIYFAGGEPLMMEEHYNILDELERRGRFDVRLIYNTNFTQTKLKDRTVFDYWKRFNSVAVGASLDAMGPRAEYIRRGTAWDQVERNRSLMMEVCPEVDFYVSPTLSIMNAEHLPEFHRAWVGKGFIRPQDLNVNILQDPEYYRIDIAPTEYKARLQSAYLEHLEWLRPLDRLNRATAGFESAITFMNATDNTHLIPKFWAKTNELDQIRNENILDVIPELRALK